MKKNILIILSLAAVLIINIYFRAFPIYFPQLKEQAQSILDQNIRMAVMREVEGKFPQYDVLAKEKLLKTRMAEYKKYGKKEVAKEVNELYRRLKDRYQDENGQTYIMELDCWHWARYTENVFNLGRPGDEVKNGKQIDTLMLAPEGVEVSWDNFLFYLSAFLYRSFLFFKYVPLFTFVFYLPLLFCAVFIIALFGFSFYHGRYWGALVSCLFVGLTSNFIPRSCAGWFDKDIFNMFFPIAVMWPYLLAYQSSGLKKKLAWIAVSGLCVGLFCFTWPHWWFIFAIIIAYEIISLCVMLFLRRQYKKDNLGLLKQHVVSLCAFLAFSVLWISVFCGFEPFKVLYKLFTDAFVLNRPMVTSIWPNVYSTVGELKTSNIREMVNSLGGGVVFAAAVISLLVVFTRNIFFSKGAGFKRESSIILVLWFLGMLYACFRGVRFVVFLSVPLGISLGWGINDLYEYFKSKKLVIQGFVVTFVIVLLLSLSFINTAGKVARGIFPLINDPWYKVLNVLKDTTPKGAILNSWWDFGDWFKVIAGRRVIFDGQSQNSPQAYWMAKALLTQNEKESLAILRMLNKGGNKAFEIIDGYLNDPLRSMLLLESVITLEPDKAKEKLADFLPASSVNKIAGLLFDKPLDAYFIVDYSMVYKIGAISYLGNWNFAKVYIVQNFNKKEKEQILDYLIKLGKNPIEMQRLYQEAFIIPTNDFDNWISRPVQFYSPQVKGGTKDGLVYFENGFIYNPGEKTIYTSAGQIPRSLFVPKQDHLAEVAFTNANVNFSVLVFEDKGKYSCVLMDRELAGSVFVRLYFLKGMGLKHFSSHINAEEGNNFIGSYKINW